MAGKQVNFEVNVDSSDGIRGLKDFGRAAERAGKDAAKALDETATSGDKARAAIKQMASTFDTELRGAAQAAEALSKALGPELAGRMDVNQIVVDLERMGVTFDEIRLEADAFATTLRDVDGIKLQQVNDGLGNMSSKLDAVRSSSDQSRSVLANLAGNAAQDLGELGGVAGTAGVALGQLAEYATEGNISLSNLAGVAGPMLGIAAATQIISSQMKNMAQTDAFNADQVKEFAEAAAEAGASLDTLDSHLRDIRELAGRVGQDGVLGGFLSREETVNAAIELGRFGVTLEDMLGLAGKSQDEFIAFRDTLVDMGMSTDDANDAISIMSSTLNNWETATADADATARFFAPTIESLNESLDGLADPLSKQPALWDALIRDVADGTFNFENAADAVRILGEETGMTSDAVVELVKQKADEHLEEVAAAAEEAATEALRLAEAMAELGDTMTSIDVDDIANIGGALTEALDAADATIDFQSVKENLRSAFGDLQTYIEDNGVEIDWSKVLDTSKDTGLPAEFFAAISDVRDQFQSGIGAAFDIGGASAAQHFVDSFLPQLTALGMSPAQAYEILGLPADGSVTATIKPFVDAEAKADALAILDSLIGVDPDNPILAYMRLGVQTDEIPAQVAEAAARILAAEALNVPAKLEEFTQADIDAATALIADQEIDVPVRVDDQGTVQDFSDDADEATEDRTTQVIVPKSDSLGAMQELIDHVARPRTVAFTVTADNAGAINTILNAIAADRSADMNVIIHGGGEAERRLDQIAEDRFADIFVRRHGSVSGTTTGGAGAGTLAAPLAAPTALGAEDEVGISTLAATPAVLSGSTVAAVVPPGATVTNNLSVTVQAAVIGNRHEVERTVAKALRSHARLNGSRN